MFGFFARVPEFGVISILLAATRIAPRGLQVAARIRTDPHVFVGRRYRKFRDACEHARVTYGPAAGANVAESWRRPLAGRDPHASDAAALVIDVNEASRHGWHGRRLPSGSR